MQALGVAVAAIAVGPLGVETGGPDRPIPSQTSAALAAAGSDPHHLRVREPEGRLPHLSSPAHSGGAGGVSTANNGAGGGGGAGSGGSGMAGSDATMLH